MIYNICQMLSRDNSNFSYSFPVTLDDGTESILFTSDEFKTTLFRHLNIGENQIIMIGS